MWLHQNEKFLDYELWCTIIILALRGKGKGIPSSRPAYAIQWDPVSKNKIKTFYVLKNIFKRMKRQPSKLEAIFGRNISDNELLFIICKETPKLNHRKTPNYTIKRNGQRTLIDASPKKMHKWLVTAFTRTDVQHHKLPGKCNLNLGFYFTFARIAGPISFCFRGLVLTLCCPSANKTKVWMWCSS